MSKSERLSGKITAKVKHGEEFIDAAKRRINHVFVLAEEAGVKIVITALKEVTQKGAKKKEIYFEYGPVAA